MQGTGVHVARQRRRDLFGVAALSNYYHTLRHLRPVQVYSRVALKLIRPRADLRPAPPVRPHPTAWLRRAPQCASMIGRREFRLLNIAAERVGEGAWTKLDLASGIDRLWLYNLHYFDDLTAADAGARRDWHIALMQDWTSANPPGHGVGWEPYPLSRRMVNWIKWAWSGGPLDESATHCLAVQARWLTRRLEYHLLGNHLLANAKALVFAGLFFAGPEAEAWLHRGLEIFAQQLPEQVLADGGHYERSTMYHAVVLEDLLDVFQALHLHRSELPPLGEDALGRWPGTMIDMRRWLWTMSHPDGDIGLFNDAALGVAATPGQLDSYAQELGLGEVEKPNHGATHLAESGYARLEYGPVVALLDLAPLGPDYLPGHAHADTLSFELSLFGQRVVVHSGTSNYREGPQREFERSTAAHNTVEIDGLSSSEMWGAFRVARRARATSAYVKASDDGCEAQATHDGYRQQGRAIHRRHWRLSPQSLWIGDDLAGSYRSAVARFHLHPQVQATLGDDRQTVRINVDGKTVDFGGTYGVVSLASAEYHPQFGTRETATCLEWRPNQPAWSCGFDWEP